MKLTDAVLKLGTATVAKVYRGADLVWPSGSPVTLESIAGPPLAQRDTGGLSDELGLGAFAARTVYLVDEVLVSAVGFRAIGGCTTSTTSSAPNGALNVRTTSTPAFQGRLAPLNSTAATAIAAARAVGHHVLALWADAGAATGGMQVDDLAPAALATAAGDGFDPLTRLGLGNVDATDAPKLAVCYAAAHDLDTRSRIIAFLARQYGAPVPAGY